MYFLPELSHTLQKFIKVQNAIRFQSTSMHRIQLTHCIRDSFTAEWSMIAVLALTFTLLHVVFDIKLRDSTGQVKVHKIKEKKETHKKEGEKKAGNERPVIVHVKPTSFTPKSSPLPTPGLKL